MINQYYSIFRRTVAILLVFQCLKFGNVDGNLRARRVVNGTQAVPHSSPWMGLLCGPNGRICGSFLISRNLNDENEEGSSDVVLTAAHCLLVEKRGFKFLDPSSSRFEVIFGKHKMHEAGLADFSVDVVQAFIHPGYKNERLGITERSNDIAILQLKYSVTYDNYTKPIRLQTMYQDSYEDCYLAGYGRTSINDVKALNVIRFKEVSFHQTEKYFQAQTKMQYTYDGDSGSTLVCQQENQPIAVGLLWGSNYTMSCFTSIQHHLDWIKKNLNRTEKAATYRSNLIDHVQNLSKSEADWISTKDHLKSSYHANTVSFNLGGQPKSAKPIDYSLIDRVHKYLEIQKGFCVGDVKQSLSVENADECAILCYKENHNGSCNYFSINNGCFLVEFKEAQPVFATNASLCMQFRDVEGHKERNSLIEQHPKKLQEGRSIKWFQQYEVAIHGNRFSNFHCMAQLESFGGEFYTTMSVSSRCMLKLWSMSSDIDFFGLVAIMDDHSIYIKININKIKWGSRRSGIATANLENPIKRHGLTHQSLGHNITSRWSTPIKRKYWPFNGAFVAQPFTMPWIVRFYESKSDSVDQYVCTGVLINQTEFLPEGYKDRTNFVLASTSCLAEYQMNMHENLYGLIGLYPSGELPAVKAIPLRTISDYEWPDQGFVLVQLKEEIKFIEYVQPVQWPSRNLSTYSTHFIASTSKDISPDFPWTKDPMTEIPIFIDSDAEGHLNITKIYKRSGNLDDVNNGDPIIACHTDLDTDCAIIGFFWSSGANENYQQQGLAIYPHLDNINLVLSEAAF